MAPAGEGKYLKGLEEDGRLLDSPWCQNVGQKVRFGGGDWN